MHLLIFTALNTITSKYIIVKYKSVFTHAFDENVNLNFVISASKRFATRILINCDNTAPRKSPTTSETMPINNVSKKRIIDIFLLLIPSVR